MNKEPNNPDSAVGAHSSKGSLEGVTSNRPEMELGRFEDTSLQAAHAQLMREKAEPIELYKPIPMTLMWIIFVLFAWAGYYLSENSGQWRSDVFDPHWTPSGAAATVDEVDYYSMAWQLDRGKNLYSNNCATCHQASGLGLTGVYPPLAGAEWVNSESELLLKILLRGLQGNLTVLGNTYNGAMPSYGENGGKWRDRDIAAVATYVRNSFGNSSTPITEEIMLATRAAVAAKTDAYSEAELLALHQLVTGN